MSVPGLVRSWGLEVGSHLVKISAQKVHLLIALEQTRPVFSLEFLLSEDHLDIGCGVVGLGVFYINLAVELNIEVIGGLLGF